MRQYKPAMCFVYHLYTLSINRMSQAICHTRCMSQAVYVTNWMSSAVCLTSCMTQAVCHKLYVSRCISQAVCLKMYVTTWVSLCIIGLHIDEQCTISGRTCYCITAIMVPVCSNNINIEWLQLSSWICWQRDGSYQSNIPI